jgi:hypothetical protein
MRPGCLSEASNRHAELADRRLPTVTRHDDALLTSSPTMGAADLLLRVAEAWRLRSTEACWRTSCPRNPG